MKLSTKDSAAILRQHFRQQGLPLVEASLDEGYGVEDLFADTIAASVAATAGTLAGHLAEDISRVARLTPKLKGAMLAHREKLLAVSDCRTVTKKCTLASLTTRTLVNVVSWLLWGSKLKQCIDSLVEDRELPNDVRDLGLRYLMFASGDVFYRLHRASMQWAVAWWGLRPLLVYYAERNNSIGLSGVCEGLASLHDARGSRLSKVDTNAVTPAWCRTHSQAERWSLCVDGLSRINACKDAACVVPAVSLAGNRELITLVRLEALTVSLNDVVGMLPMLRDSWEVFALE